MIDMKWLKGVEPEKKAEFESLLRNSSLVLNKLSDILHALDDGAEKSTKADYNSPSWAFLQADTNGYRRALKDVLSLIQLK